MNDASQVQAKSRFRCNGILSCDATENLTNYASNSKDLLTWNLQMSALG
jgi:hypothetical protein